MCVVVVCSVLVLGVGVVVGFGLSGSPLRRTPLRRTAQNFALFLPSPAPYFRSGCLLVECWVFFESRDPEMCTFGPSGCRVKPRRLRGRRGFTHQPENSKLAHFRTLAL